MGNLEAYGYFMYKCNRKLEECGFEIMLTLGGGVEKIQLPAGTPLVPYRQKFYSEEAFKKFMEGKITELYDSLVDLSKYDITPDGWGV